MTEERPSRRFFSLSGNVAPSQLVAGLAAGALFGPALPPLGLWPLALFSSSAFLLLIRDRRPAEARNLGLFYGLGLAASTLHWFSNVFGIFSLSLIGLFAAYYGLLGNLAALTRDQKPGRRAILTAIFAVGIEWLRGDAWRVRFPWYTMPHAVAVDPSFAAAVRWTGTYGFSFFLWLVAAAGAFGNKRWWNGFLLLFIPALFLPDPALPNRRAILVQAEETTRIERILTTEIPDTSADIVVLPEYAYFVPYESAQVSPRGPATLARRLKAPVVYGAIEGNFESGTFHNVAVLLSETGAVAGIFPKQHPVPFVFDGLPGRFRPVFPAAGGTLGIGICYDFDAPEIAASLVLKGATVLAAPTFDALHWGELQHDHHELLLRLRAIETNRWILRATSSGRSEIIDPLGRPSREGLGFGENGHLVGRWGHREEISWGVRLSILGPLAGLLSVLSLLRILRRTFWTKS